MCSLNKQEACEARQYAVGETCEIASVKGPSSTMIRVQRYTNAPELQSRSARLRVLSSSVPKVEVVTEVVRTVVGTK
jgi:hypothetical protein